MTKPLFQVFGPGHSNLDFDVYYETNAIVTQAIRDAPTPTIDAIALDLGIHRTRLTRLIKALGLLPEYQAARQRAGLAPLKP